jgi:hypothetical protein
MDKENLIYSIVAESVNFIVRPPFTVVMLNTYKIYIIIDATLDSQSTFSIQATAIAMLTAP